MKELNFNVNSNKHAFFVDAESILRPVVILGTHDDSFIVQNANDEVMECDIEEIQFHRIIA